MRPHIPVVANEFLMSILNYWRMEEGCLQDKVNNRRREVQAPDKSL
jgi:hypothetical protein